MAGALAFVIAAACVAASAHRLLAVRKLVTSTWPAWQSELARDVATYRTDAERTAYVNEQLFDLESDLRKGGPVPRAAARISLAAALCVLFWTLASRSWNYLGLGIVLGSGMVGTMTCFAIARAVDRQTEGLRRHADRFVSRTLEALASNP